MNGKKIILIVGVLIILVIAGYRRYMYLGYASALDDAEEKWLNEVFIPSKIVGVIHEFNEPSGDDCFSNLIIEQVDGEKFASGICVCNENKSFKTFASVGDSVVKDAGSKIIWIKKVNGEKKEFDFPFCKD